MKNAKIVHAAAGTDHAVAISEDGHVYAWGAYDNGQYGWEGSMIASARKQPEELMGDNTIDASQVRQLVAGNQVTAILMEDGTIYAWGNDGLNATNLSSVIKHGKKESKLVKLAFTNDGLYGIDEDGNFVPGKSSKFNTITIQDENGQNKVVDIFEYIGDRKIVDIAATGGAIALVTDDGELIVAGMKEATPVIPEGDTIKHVSGGTRHFTLVTEQGRVYAWGQNFRKQCEVPADLQEAGAVDTVFSSGFQNYAFKDGKFVEAWGLKGYVFGTDDMGRDVFNRLMNGGKMTMTIGAVAVIVSTIIGIIVGCISGYFGGWVDILLMRVTEIVGAIPFLPFALVLSAILQSSDLHENTRIFIIMLILGLLSWTGLAKLIRGQILAEREKEFVTAARSMGVKEGRIAFKHILPNVISVILVSVTLDFAGCMLTESSLSYLGFGVQLPRPTWGNMLDGSRNALVIQSYWWRWVFPALFLSIVVICINIIGDTLREVLDPKSEVDK
ncbi:MAG: ABC transporter permease subunit [Oscillospiraceae bacterium]